MGTINEVIDQVTNHATAKPTLRRDPKRSRFYGLSVGVPAICPTHGRYTKMIDNYGTPNAIDHGCYQCEREELEGDTLTINQRVNLNLMNCGIPKRFDHCTFDSFNQNDQNTLAYATSKKYADNFADRYKNGGGLLFHGKCGTGKTHLACAIAKQIIYTGDYSAVYTGVYDMVSDIKSTWNDKSRSEYEVVSLYTQPHLLIIDEVGVQFGTEAEQVLLFQVMNKRYEDVKPTILLSNLDLDELKSCIGERLIDRMNEGGGARIGFTWESYRK